MTVIEIDSIGDGVSVVVREMDGAVTIRLPFGVKWYRVEKKCGTDWPVVVEIQAVQWHWGKKVA